MNKFNKFRTKDKLIISLLFLIIVLLVVYLFIKITFDVDLINKFKTVVFTDIKSSKTITKDKDSNKIIKTKSNKTNFDDNLNLPSAPNNYNEYLKLKDGKYLTSNNFVLNIINHNAYIDNNLIVNKTYILNSNYKPRDMVNPDFNGYGRSGSDKGLEKIAYNNYTKLRNDAKKAGLNIYASSGYRCYNFQKELYDNCNDSYGAEYTDTFLSRPGCSEHQSGLALDVNSIDSSFDNTPEAKWLSNNCFKYGFCIRYPKNKEKFTGFDYESWHIRYVGMDLATKLYNNNDWITLEEYYGITSKY